MEIDQIDCNKKLLKKYKLLPYFNEINDESREALRDIKTYLGSAVLLRDIRSITFWTTRLTKYTNVYGFKFSTCDHVTLIHILYDLTTLTELDYHLISRFVKCLINLMRKPRLLVPGKDLILPWRPLFELYKKLFPPEYTKRQLPQIPNVLQTELKELAHCCRCYFKLSETKYMLREIRQYFCLSDSSIMSYGMELLCYFLPIPVEGNDSDVSYKLWLTELMNIWNAGCSGAYWCHIMFTVLSSLAYNNIGYIDWEPYFSEIFSRILLLFNLPVNYKNFSIQIILANGHSLSTWIINTLGGGSKSQDYLDQLLKTIESYCRPVNVGGWIRNLKLFLPILTESFMDRLKRETIWCSRWGNKIPDTHKLNDSDITRFVNSVQGVALNAMYNIHMISELCIVFQNLAYLKPQIVIPPILERLYLQLDSVTETYKLVAALTFTTAICRPLFEGAKTGAYKDGITHVVPLLFGVLPCIDANDFTKSIAAFRLIIAYTTLVPLVDSSAECDKFDDISQEEELACTSTAQFEEFVLQYLDKCLIFIENCALESTRLDRTLPEKTNNYTDICFKNIVIFATHRVLQNTSSSIFTAALKKVHNFCMTRIFERNVAGKQIAKMLSIFSSINGPETLKIVLPSICDYIMEFMDNNIDIQKEENLDHEFLYKLMILCQVVRCAGDALIMYLPRLTSIMERTLHMTSKEASNIASNMLKFILKSLSRLHFRSIHKRVPNNQPPSLSVREWSNIGVSLDDIEVDWYYPRMNELYCIEQLVFKFLLPELEIIDRYGTNQDFITREELSQTLNIIHAVLTVNYLFAPWEDAQADIYDMKIRPKSFNVHVGIPRYIYMPDGSNISMLIVEKLINLQNIILRHKEDETKSLEQLISIWEILLPIWNMLHPTEKQMKQFMDHKLLRKDQNIMFIAVVEACIRHDVRLFELSNKFTQTHVKIIENLLTLCVNHYGQIRKRAQLVIAKIVKQIPEISSLSVNMLVENLKVDTKEQHDKFKGTLFLLVELLPQLYILSPGYRYINTLLPALVTSMPPEKLTTINLIEGMTDRAFKFFATKNHNLLIPDTILSRAKTLWLPDVVTPIIDQPSEKQIQDCREEMYQENKKIATNYKELMMSLWNATNYENLHWRNLLMALDLFNILAHDKDFYSAEHVNFFLKLLIHDSNFVRKKAICCVSKVLHQHKRRLKKNTVNPFVIARLEEKSAVEYDEIEIGYREDNQWLLYNPENIPTDENKWNAQCYSHVTHIGYYRWPKELRLYAPPNEQESMDKCINEMTQVEREFHTFFSNDENVGKLLNYYAMERGKNELESFRIIHFLFFKGLFHNFGDRYIESFRERLTDLIRSNQKSSQISATELIAGIICGSSHWPFDKHQALSTWLVPLIHTAFDCGVQEIMHDWISCFSFGLSKNDVNKASYIIKALTDNPVKQDTTYKDTGRILALSSLNKHGWRMPYILHHLLECYKPHLSHPYKQIRDTLGMVLPYVFRMDVRIDGWNNTQAPRASEFVLNYVLPRLDDLYKLATLANEETTSPNGINIDIPNGIDEKQIQIDDKRKDDVNFLRTICVWIFQTGSAGEFQIPDEFYLLLPLLCSMTNYEQDYELKGLCNAAISVLATNVATSPSSVTSALCAAHETSKIYSWYARLVCLEFLQPYVFFNMAFVSNIPTFRTEILTIVEKLLVDDRVEVRTKSGQVMGSLVHCGFIKTPETYLKKFVQMSKTSYIGDKTNLYVRHAGVIGLCALINANPYDVPDYVPKVFVELNNHMRDPEPIPSTIRKTLGDFKRTHYNDWEMQRKKFTDEEISIFTDMVLPPTYYA